MADTKVYATIKMVDEAQVKCAVRYCPNDGEIKHLLDIEGVHDLGWFRVYLCGDCHNSLSRDAFEKFTGVKIG